MNNFTEQLYIRKIILNKNFILAGDIGGTNTNLAVFDLNKRLILSLHLNTKEIKNFPEFIKEILTHLKSKYKISVSKACFAIAGTFTNKNIIKMTNLPLLIDVNKLKKVTSLKNVYIINDFQAISYGIEILNKKDILIIKRGKPVKQAAKVVLGAGTGLGKSIMVYNEKSKDYTVLHSEGGHAEISYNNQDFELFEFLRKNSNNIIQWEDILSGTGIRNIYMYLLRKNNTAGLLEIKKSGYNSELISKYKYKDEICNLAMKIFTRFYARCAKNFALDALALNGVYIAGRIAIKNPELFTDKKFGFVMEFLNTRKINHVLEAIPVYLINNHNIALYGCANLIIKKSGVK